MSLIEHAKKELESAGLFDETKDFYGGNTGKSVMELIELFSRQGHSGMSASLVTNLFKELIDYKPLSPIQGVDAEWIEVQPNEFYQNKRLPSLFKEYETGKSYYLDAIVWMENGVGFCGEREGLTSRQYVKFPFTPKTFYVEVKGENIVDKEELQKALEYYKQ